MKKIILLLFTVLSVQILAQVPISKLRAPAYPLITIDPYISAWAHSDKLYDDVVRHWTGNKIPLNGILRVDGISYRFLGKDTYKLLPLLNDSSGEKWECKYTFDMPLANWYYSEYDDSSWKSGYGALGSKDKSNVSTNWSEGDIWVRREFSFSEDVSKKRLFLVYSHDDVFELYINGKKIVDTDCTWNNHVVVQLDENTIKSLLQNKKNIIAAHCHNTSGGAYVDFGIFTEEAEHNSINNASQIAAHISPTQTFYSFYCGPVQLNLTFSSPLILSDLLLLSTPINYITYDITSLDKKDHDVQIYFSASPLWAVNSSDQKVVVEKYDLNDLRVLKTGTLEQNVLGKSGDILCIDWGYFYLSGKINEHSKSFIGDSSNLEDDFICNGNVSDEIFKSEVQLNEQDIIMGYTEDLNIIGRNGYEGFIMLGYDDINSIQYFGENLNAYWKKYFKNIDEALNYSFKNYKSIKYKCNKWDDKIMKDALLAGGQQYAELCAISYRQAVAAHKLVIDSKDKLYFFSKENNSNGSIGTVDVTYPSCPLFLLYNTNIMKAMLEFIYDYSESGRWQKPFPAHDVGTYPLANGQTYAEDMPVEEAGNMIIMTAAIAAVEKNADYAEQHWETLTTWANYLLEKGMDPENQLCTEDFAGHLAHNANLSAKAIMGIACYGYLAKLLNKKDSDLFLTKAKEMALQWIDMADDGDHYKLAFDRPNTWSQKYNFVWDKVLDLNILPKGAMDKEISFYLKKQNKYGLPLDNRYDWSKIDDTVWIATMANTNKDFQSLINPLWLYVNETESRVPLGDWHDTITGDYINFRARSVVGGVFMKSLEHYLNN